MTQGCDDVVVVLLSGGIDSAVCLQIALDSHDDVRAVHVGYGQQTGEIECENAERQADSAGVPLHYCDYRSVFGECAEGTVADRDYESAQTTDGEHSVGYVPQRNIHFCATAAAIGEHHAASGQDILVYHGAHCGDRADYPDCRPSFLTAAETALTRGTDHHDVTIETPLIDCTKAEVLTLGMEYGVQWEHTFSCYNDVRGDPCGNCPACLERRDAFAESDVDDPVVKA